MICEPETAQGISPISPLSPRAVILPSSSLIRRQFLAHVCLAVAPQTYKRRDFSIFPFPFQGIPYTLV